MKTYITNCINSTAKQINKMVERCVEIQYSDLLKHVTQDELDMVFPIYRECENLTLENDYTTSFYKSKYDGIECVYVEHSMVEYIFS